MLWIVKYIKQSLICYFDILCSVAVQFKFTPSHNIGVYQLAHYQCSNSVDHTGVSVTCCVNGAASGYCKIIKLGIDTGWGSQEFSLIISAIIVCPMILTL